MPHPLIDIQQRDLEVLSGLLESRIMTLAHIAEIHFDGRREAAKKRIFRLKAAGFIAERRRRPYEPAILSAAPSAYRLLDDRGLLDGCPEPSALRLDRRRQISELTLTHELEVMDAKAAFYAGVRSAVGLRVAEFSTRPASFQFKAAPAPGQPDVLVKPDAFIRLNEVHADGKPYEHVYFLEIDRSTETQERVGLKAASYVDYYRRGGFAERNGHDASEYKNFPFLVLMAFRNAERRNNAVEQLLIQPVSIRTQVWLTTMAELKSAPLGAIWVLPADYLRATDQTVYDAYSRSGRGIYKRDAARDAFIEGSVPKHRLLGDQ